MKNDDKFRGCEHFPAGSVVGAFRYDTKTVLRFCIPDLGYTDIENLGKIMQESFLSNVFGQEASKYFYDLANSWWVLLLSAVIALLIAYVYLVAIRFFGGWLIWAAFGLSVLILAGGGYLTYSVFRLNYEPESQNY